MSGQGGRSLRVRGALAVLGVFALGGTSAFAIESRESVVLGADATQEALRKAAESLRLAESVDSISVARDITGRRTILVTDWSRFARDGDVWAVLAARVAPASVGADGFPPPAEPAEATVELLAHGKVDARTGLGRLYHYRPDSKPPRGIGLTDIKASDARAAERAAKWPDAPAIEPVRLPSFTSLDCGAPLRGRLLDGSRVTETLATAPPGSLVGRRDADGLVTLEAATPRGHATLRVDPSRGHVLVGFRVVWQHTDEFEGQPLWKSFIGQGERKTAGDVPRAEDRRVRAELRVEVSRTQRVSGVGSGDGAWLATEGEVAISTTMRRGPEHVQLRQVRRVSLTPAREGQGLLTREVTAPDGTPARYAGVTGGVAHEWRDGRPVPRVNEQAVSKLSQVADLATPTIAHALAPGAGSAWRGPGTGLSILIGTLAAMTLIVAVTLAGRRKPGGP